MFFHTEYQFCKYQAFTHNLFLTSLSVSDRNFNNQNNANFRLENTSQSRVSLNWTVQMSQTHFCCPWQMCSGLLAILSQSKETEVTPTDCRTRNRVLVLPVITRRGRTGTGLFLLFFSTLSLRVRKILFKKLKGDRKNMKPQDCKHFCRNHGKEYGLKLFCGCSPTKPVLLCDAQAKTEHSNFPSSSPSNREKTGASQIKNRLMLQFI